MARRSRKRGSLRDVAKKRGGRKSSTRRPSRSSPSSSRRKSRSSGSIGGSGSAHTRGGTGRKRPASTPKPARRSSSEESSSPLRDEARRRGGQKGEPSPSRLPSSGVPRRSPGRKRPAATSGGVGSAGGTRVADLQAQMAQLETRFSQLQAQAQLGDLQQKIGRLDARINELPRELEALRSRGYIHAGLVGNDIEDVARQWEETRPRVRRTLDQHASGLNSAIADASAIVNRMSPRNAASLDAASNVLTSLQSQIGSARSAVSGLFAGVEQPLSFLEQTVERFDWVLEQFQRSPGVRLLDTEAPLMAVEAEWERSGDEGPKGMLFLTDQRLLFEQNEEVATEKLFGIFATEKEKRQELLIDVPIREIERVDHGAEGGFLGLGKEQKLNLILGPQAPVSRATFQLEGQEAADWAVWIKKVQTGEIDRDRAEGYLEEVRAAEARAQRFPSKCPSCLAPLPPPGRGAEYVVCDFCGTIVRPGDEAEPTSDPV